MTLGVLVTRYKPCLRTLYKEVLEVEVKTSSFAGCHQQSEAQMRLPGHHTLDELRGRGIRKA